MSLKKYVKFLWILRRDKVFSEKQKKLRQDLLPSRLSVTIKLDMRLSCKICGHSPVMQLISCHCSPPQEEFAIPLSQKPILLYISTLA